MIDARQLYKGFDHRAVLRGVDLHVARGESAVILGASGGGKSVLLKLLIGLMPPDSGEVYVDGHRMTHLDERELLALRHRFGMLFQSAALFDSMTVSDNVAFGLRQERRWTERQIRAKVDEALEMVELGGIGDRNPAELSGGMRKRVGLARAIVYRPDIILYDEPTTGLDPIVADSIDELIVRIRSQFQTTSVTVTHDLRSARRIGQRFYFMYEGGMRASGSARELFESDDPVIQRFVKGASLNEEAAHD